MYQWANI